MTNLFLCYTLFINIYGIFLMYHDKSKAKNRQWRVPEMRLFTTAAILGSPGILLGMYIFRHKTKHLKFVFGIPLIMLIQLYILFKFII